MLHNNILNKKIPKIKVAEALIQVDLKRSEKFLQKIT